MSPPIPAHRGCCRRPRSARPAWGLGRRYPLPGPRRQGLKTGLLPAALADTRQFAGVGHARAGGCGRCRRRPGSRGGGRRRRRGCGRGWHWRPGAGGSARGERPPVRPGSLVAGLAMTALSAARSVGVADDDGAALLVLGDLALLGHQTFPSPGADAGDRGFDADGADGLDGLGALPASGGRGVPSLGSQ